MSNSPTRTVLVGCLVLMLSGVVRSEPPARDGRARTDAHGDALPPGAVVRLGSARFQHDHRPGPPAFSPDGKTMAVLVDRPETSTLWLWDIETGKNLGRFRLDLRTFGISMFCPDGRLLAMTLEGVCLLDTATGKTVRELRLAEEDWREQQLSRVALSPDGRVLALGCRSRFLNKTSPILLYDLATGKELRRLSGHRTPVDALAFSADGRRLLSVGEDKPLVPGGVCIWEVSSGKLLRQRNQPGEYKVFSPDGRTMAFTGTDERAHLWDVDGGKEIARLPVEGWAYCFVSGGKYLATGKGTALPCLWDATTGKEIRRFRGRRGKGTWVSGASPDGKWLVTSAGPWAFNNAIRLWDVAKGTEWRPFGGHLDTVTCLAFAPDGKTVVSGSKDGALRVWDVATSKELRVYRRHEEPITAVAIAPDGKAVLSGDNANAVHLWDLATGKQAHRFAFAAISRRIDRGGVQYVGFMPDGKTLLAGSAEVEQRGESDLHLKGVTGQWDRETGKRLRYEEQDILPLGVSPSGKALASAEFVERNILALRMKLFLRSASDSTAVELKAGAAGVPDPLVFSVDGKTVAAGIHTSSSGIFGGGTSEERYRVWEAVSGKEIVQLKRGGPVMAFAPDGGMLAAAGRSNEHAIRLMDPATGQDLGQFLGHLDEVTCCAFSPDGRFLASGSADQTILLWDRARAKPAGRAGKVDTTPRGLDALWRDLIDPDATRAYAAIASLSAVPRHSLPLLRERLRPVAAVSAADIEKHVKALDSGNFTQRERATVALEKLGDLAQPALQKLLDGGPSLEARRRAERLLTKLERTAGSAEDLLALRATAVLERLGTTEARRLLQTLADGAPGARLTEQAKASLGRLARRPTPTQ